MKITQYTIKNRIAASVIVLGLVVLGLYGLWRLPVNFLPNMAYPLIKVYVWWPGATPNEIDRSLADPIERVVATVDGVDSVESSAIEGMYSLMLNFRYGVRIDTAYQDTLAAMARVARQLPKDIDPPVVIKADPSQLPVVQLTVQSDSWDLVKLRSWAENSLEPVLTSVPGVAGTEIVGGLQREIRVKLDADALVKYNLSISSVLAALREDNLDQFSGRITRSNKEFVVRTSGEFKNLEEIRAVVVAHDGMSKVLLSDIASVEDAHQDIRVITRLDGKQSIKVSVLKQADANTVEVANAVNKTISSLESGLPKGVKLGMVENQAIYVESAIDGVRNAAIEAALLVILVVYIFLGSWRQMVAMSLVLPITLAINFGLMQLFGFSLNIFSLGGLVVAIGVVLDNATVVIENITRLQHANQNASIEENVLQGTTEVGPAIVAATLSFLALFIPFLIVPSLTTLLFKELIFVVAGIVVLSLAIAVTLTPMLGVMFLGKQSASSKFELFYDKVSQRYRVVLERVLKAPKRVMAIFILLFCCGVALVPYLGSEFLPQMDDGRVMIKLKLPTGTAIGETNRILEELESLVSTDPLVESAFTLVGGKVWGLVTSEVAEEGQIDIQLVARSKRNITTLQYLKTLRKRVSAIKVPGGKVMVMQQKVKGLRKLGDADIEVKIKGPDLDQLYSIATKALARMNATNVLTNVYISLDMTKPEYQVHVDRIKASELGVSVNAVGAALRSLISGSVATQYRDEGRYYNVRVLAPEVTVRSMSDISKLPIKTNQGNYIRLGDVAKVDNGFGPVEIIRENQIKQVILRADGANVSVGSAKNAAISCLPEDLPAGYTISIGGQAQMQEEMISSMLVVLLFSLFFSFIVLAVQFNSLKLPVLILSAVPFCAIGMVYALFLTNIPIGATVVIGALVVISSTVNEGVLLLTFAEHLRVNSRYSPIQAVVTASTLRLRPRLMIGVTIIAGFLPLALNLEEGGDMLQPMAVSAIGGVAAGIFVALLMVPCLYVLCASSFSGAIDNPLEKQVDQ